MRHLQGVWIGGEAVQGWGQVGVGAGGASLGLSFHFAVNQKLLQNIVFTFSKKKLLLKYYVRIGKDMFERRGGFNYFLKYFRGRKAIKDTGFISNGDFLLTIMVQLIICLLPNRIRGFVFKKLLHR